MYDLLLRGAHVVDPLNGVNGIADVAVADGKIAAQKDNTVNGVEVKPVKRETAPAKKAAKKGPQQPDLFGGL